jgi:hypothetical protein
MSSGHDARRRRLADALPLLLVCAAAFATAWPAVRDLRWPGDPDLFRDLAQAQTMADGGVLDDPAYANKRLWYPPLVPGLVAGAAVVAGAEVPLAYVRLGPLLNLAAPVAFFVLLRAWLSPGAALVATFHMVFLRPVDSPAWLAATYSPWLLAPVFVQAPFYLGLLAVARGLAHGGPALVAGGLLAGVVALGHVAPAVLLALFAALLAARAPRLRAPRLALTGVLAAAVASPLIYALVVGHRLQVRNPQPLSWIWAAFLDPAAVRRAVTGTGLELALGGAALLLALRRRDPRHVPLLAWAAASLAGLAHALLAPSLGLPLVAPLHHFVFAWRAVQSALIGLAVAAGLGWLAGRLRSSWRERPPAWPPAAATAALIAAVLPTYAARRCFTAERASALAESGWRDRAEAVRWLRAHTAREAVIAAEDDLALRVALAAGRRTLALDPRFSSPYVLLGPRQRRRDALLLRAQRGDEAGLLAMARDAGVEYVLARPAQVAALRADRVAWSSPTLALVRVGP